MTDILRLAFWLRSAKTWTLLAILLGIGTVAANTGLLGTATYLVSAAATHPPLVALAGALMFVRLLGVSRPFARYAERLVSHDVSLRLLAHLRVWLFGRLVALALGQLIALRSADLLTRLVRDVDEADTVFQHLVGPVLVALLTLAVVGGLFWSIDPMLGVIALGSLFLVGFGIPFVVVLATNRPRQDLVRQRADLDVSVSDTLYGLPDLLSFGRSAAQIQAMTTIAATIERLQLQLAGIAGLRAAAHDAIARLGAWSVLLYAVILASNHHVESVYVAVLAIVMLGATEALEPLNQAAQRIAGTRAAAARIWSIADQAPAIAFAPESAEILDGRSLEFRNVSFTYDGPPVLNDINLQLQRGQAIGIVGPSGAGKSTLLQLAARAWDPPLGEVLLDGRSLRQFSSASLARSIGLLSHDSYIFSGSVRQNLQLGDPCATSSAMQCALREAGLAELLEQLPDGLDTSLGEQGARLSGGERQRLALARMLLHAAPFLLFDEPTANLDALTERAVMRLIQQQRQTHGVLLVSHRLQDLDWLDEILVLDAGRVVERGRPAELRGAGGLFADLLAVQDGMLSERSSASRFQPASVAPTSYVLR